MFIDHNLMLFCNHNVVRVWKHNLVSFTFNQSKPFAYNLHSMTLLFLLKTLHLRSMEYSAFHLHTVMIVSCGVFKRCYEKGAIPKKN